MAVAALERCVGDPEAFVRETWSRGPALYRATDPDGFHDLLTLDDVDRIVSSMALRVPAFRLIKDGVTLPESSYTKSGRAGSKPMTGLADAARMFRLFDDGATIVLQGLHRFWLPLARFCRELEIALGHPTQVNAYVTPAGSRGLAVHEDSHDVFVLQAFGSKYWEVWETGRPVRDGKVDASPAISSELGPGDALYMPRRTPHAARTQKELSGHLTVGIPATTWREAVQAVVQRALDESGLDEPLPAGYHRDRDRFAAELDGRISDLQRRLEKTDPGEAAGATIDRFLTGRPSLLRGGLVQRSMLGALDDRSTIGRRRGSICELRPAGDALTILLGDRALRMPAWCEPVMRQIAGNEAFRIGDLEPFLDAEGRLTLVRRLIREGLLEVVGGD